MRSETPRKETSSTATLKTISRSARSREVMPGRGPSPPGPSGRSGPAGGAMSVIRALEGRADPAGRGGPGDEIEAPDEAEIAARAHLVVLPRLQEIRGRDRHAIETGQE